MTQLVRDSVLFIGLGNMGGPLAMNLMRAGVELAVADLSASSREPFVACGIPAKNFGADLPGDVVITCLPTDRNVREALLGRHGALTQRKRTTVIDMTSASPLTTKNLAAELAERDVAMIDAPVSGGVPRAKVGDVTTMVGGDPNIVERCRPLLSIMCSTVRHVGPIGAGHTMKVINNYISLAALWATCEGLIIGSKAGLDLQAMVETLKTSSGHTNALDTKVIMSIMPRTFDYGATMEILSKDISQAARLARELDVPAPTLAQAEEHWLLAKTRFGADADFTNFVRLLEELAAHELPVVARNAASSV